MAIKDKEDKGFAFPAFDYSDILNIGLGIVSFYQRSQQIKQKRFEQESAFEVYKSQKDLNAEISTFNFNQRLRAAAREASSLRVSFASAGLSGGTLEDDIRRYSSDLLLTSF